MLSRSEACVHYTITHRTRYQYASEVLHAHHLLHLVPRPSPHQQCLEHRLQLEPAQFRRVDVEDAFGNPLTRIEILQPHSRLEVCSELGVVVHPRPAIAPGDTLPWEQVTGQFVYQGAAPARERLEAAQFRHESPHVRIKGQFAEWARDCFTPATPVLSGAVALCGKLHAEVRYAPGVTTVATTVSEVLRERRGVCQDFAHLMLACLRSLGMPARYVSGYLHTAPPQGSGSLQGADASHAWVSVWCPPLGWIELDPTNGCFAGTSHVALAWGRDFGDVSPLRGVILGGAQHQLAVSVRVVPEGPTAMPAGVRSLPH